MTVLQVPSKFSNLAMLKFHVEQHHGYFFGDVKTVAEGRKAHAEMHRGSNANTLHAPVAHVHADVTELSVIGFNDNEGN